MYGPIQLTAIAFDNEEVIGGLLDELERVREFGIIRLIDFLFVAKDADGNISALEVSDLDMEEMVEFGAVVGGLIGLGAAGVEGAEVGAVAGALSVAENDFGLTTEEVREVADRLPRGSSGVLVLFEHTWALRLKEYIVDSGGVLIAQGLIHPSALVEVGAELAAAVEAEEFIEREMMLEEELDDLELMYHRGEISEGEFKAQKAGFEAELGELLSELGSD
jgi:uncharacterized membrane protein